jgi:hypothetical protein
MDKSIGQSDGHYHKCKECGIEYKHYTKDVKCKEPQDTYCGKCKEFVT